MTIPTSETEIKRRMQDWKSCSILFYLLNMHYLVSFFFPETLPCHGRGSARRAREGLHKAPKTGVPFVLHVHRGCLQNRHDGGWKLRLPACYAWHQAQQRQLEQRHRNGLHLLHQVHQDPGMSGAPFHNNARKGTTFGQLREQLNAVLKRVPTRTMWKGKLSVNNFYLILQIHSTYWRSRKWTTYIPVYDRLFKTLTTPHSHTQSSYTHLVSLLGVSSGYVECETADYKKMADGHYALSDLANPQENMSSSPVSADDGLEV